MFKIDKSRSNKLINTVKIIGFASCLGMMIPTTVEAKENTINIESVKENMNLSAKFALGCYGGSVVTLIGLGLLYKINNKDDEMNNKKSK